MKKLLTILVLIFISAGIIFLVDFLSNGTEESVLNISKGDTVKEFEKEIEKIAQSEWNKVLYTQVLDKLQTYRDQKIITTTDAIKVEGFLQVSYAKSLLNSFKTWQQSNGLKPLNNLDIEIKNVSANSEGKAILQKANETIQNYITAMQFPATVNNLVSLELNEAQCELLNNRILNVCNAEGISHFPSVISIKETQSARILAFKIFAQDFINIKKLYESNHVNFLSDFLEYCPDRNTEISQYSYYFNLFKSINICPDEY